MIFNTKWRKIYRDLFASKARSLLVIVAIAIGIFGISVVANSYAILLREMNKNYMSTNPASATLWTDPLSESDLDQIKALPYIREVETREKIVGRVQIGENEWKDIWLFVVKDFNNLRIDTFTPESGSFSSADGEILLERKALNLANAEVGNKINIRIQEENITTLQLTGSVHAPGLAPAWMEGFAYGFITENTYHLLGGKIHNSEVKIIISGDILDKQLIHKNTYELKSYLEANGIKVYRIDIPNPGRHPHYTQMAALLFLMEIFGFLALILSGVLVANMITAIMEQQIRQIGIMKTIGASSFQITILYLGVVTILSVLAMLFSIPAGILAGRGYAQIAAQILNFNIFSYEIPYYIFLLEIAVGFIVPVLVSLFPLMKGSSITIREALNDYGINQEKYNGRSLKSSLSILNIIPRPFLLSIRNTFRRKGRLIFTLLVMAAGGTGFIVAMNIYASMYYTVDKKMNSFLYDIQISFDHSHPIEEIENGILSNPEVKEVEAWGGTYSSRIYSDHTTGEAFNIIAPPSNTKLLDIPPMYSGRWLEPEDTNSIVINQRLLSMEPDITVGDEIILKINQKEINFTVIGISKELIGMPSAYVNMEYLTKLLGEDGYARNAVIVTNDNGVTSPAEVAKQLEKNLDEKGLQISSLIKLADYRKSLEDHLVVIASFLLVMSFLVVIVGGLGLATTISINTMERTREIGIMRATGASTYIINTIIITEGMIIGTISWLMSVILAWPLSRFVSYQFGMIFFEAPLEFEASVQGYFIWLVIVIVLSALASFYPSLKASHMTVRNTLNYE